MRHNQQQQWQLPIATSISVCVSGLTCVWQHNMCQPSCLANPTQCSQFSLMFDLIRSKPQKLCENMRRIQFKYHASTHAPTPTHTDTYTRVNRLTENYNSCEMHSKFDLSSLQSVKQRFGRLLFKLENYCANCN